MKNTQAYETTNT